MGEESHGEIPSIPPGEEKVISSNIILGFGPTKVTVKANIPESSDTRSQDGRIFLFFVYIKPSSGM